MTDGMIGGYERWSFGDGASHVLGGGLSLRSSAIAAVAEVAGQPAGNVGLAPEAALVPTLWEPAYRSGQPVATPFVLRLAAADTATAGPLPAIGTALAALAPAGVAGDGRRFRLNTPMPAAWLAGGFTPGVIDARLAAKAGAHAPTVAVVAVIDDGIPFAHRGFLRADGSTRMAFCWLQSAAPPPAAAGQSVLFGRELLGGEIDALRAGCRDEDALYRKVGAAGEPGAPPAALADFGSHGSHVAHAAAGFRHGGPASPSASLDDVAVIAVNLPTLATVDTSSFGKDAWVLAAFHYILDRTARLPGGATLPLVINFSYGFTGGPHGGGDRLERAIRQLVETRRRSGGETFLVMPSGNSFGARMHGVISAAMLAARKAAPDRFTIRWRMQPADRTCNYLELWLPAGSSPADVAINILDPSGQALSDGPFLPNGSAPQHWRLRSAGRIVGQLSAEPCDTGTGSLWRVLIAMAPTEPSAGGAPVAAAGTWRIALDGLAGILSAGDIHCRIQRDNDPYGHVRGARQSWLEDAFDRPVEPRGIAAVGDNPEAAFVRRFGTLNGLATHDRVTVVAAHVADSGRPSAYSAAGSMALAASGPGRVHLSAPGDDAEALPGRIGAGTRSGSVFRLAGTSVAAPQVTRAIARRLQAGHRAAPDGGPPLPPLAPLPVVASGVPDAEVPAGVLLVRLGAGLLREGEAPAPAIV